MIALLFVLFLVLAIWLAVRLGGVRRHDQPADIRRSARRKDDTGIIDLPGDAGFVGSAGTDDPRSDSFAGGGGGFGGGGASGSWTDAGVDGGGSDGGGGD